jgi:hypothetical protein
MVCSFYQVVVPNLKSIKYTHHGDTEARRKPRKEVFEEPEL